MKTNLTEDEIDQAYQYALASRDPDGLQQVCVCLAQECLRLRRMTILLKTVINDGRPPEPITMPELLHGATIIADPTGGVDL